MAEDPARRQARPNVAAEGPSPNCYVQFMLFLDLCSWLMAEITGDTGFFRVDKFDDPNTSVNKLMLALRKLEFGLDFPTSKLKQAHGEAAVGVLDFLTDRCVEKNFQRSSRVGPRLRVAAAAAGGKEWRAHIEQTKLNEEKIREVMPATEKQLKAMGERVSDARDKINLKENYINKQFEHDKQSYATLKQELDAVERSFNESTENVNKLTNELGGIAEQLDEMKGTMADRGNSMTDTSPLVQIKQALKQIKQEVVTFDLQIGVVGHTLMQQLRHGSPNTNGKGVVARRRRVARRRGGPRPLAPAAARRAAPSPRLGLLETLVGSLERWRGQDLVDTDPRVSAVATRSARLEAAASVAGAAPGRVRPGAGPLGRATASVTLSGSHDELLRTYAFRGGRRRRPMIVLAVDDPCLERALREYVDAHRVCEELGCDVAERPRLVLTTERATRGDVDHLQRQLRLLAKRAAVSGDAALRAAVEGVFLTDPSAVVRGVARDVSQDLLAAVVKSAAHTGHRLLRHLAARDETFTIRA
ncbi:hypothetical protein JL722_2624 [Aureococcus anophagefferens]|nr:hypothetical protein JL722_2624 [Aureococcus anophagefferens]